MTEIGETTQHKLKKDTKIKGDIVSEADLRINGKLDGNVKTSGKAGHWQGWLYPWKVVECVM